MTEFQWIDEMITSLGFRMLDGVPWAAPSQSDLARLETNLGAPLPSEYRYVLSRWTGGLLGDEDYHVESLLLEASPWGVSVDPELFNPLLSGHPCSLEEGFLAHRARLPRGVLPIASDAGGNQICLDVGGESPGSVWFWDHEQRWFSLSLDEATQELNDAGLDASNLSVHDIIREWARIHPAVCDRPADYMGMYRMAASFADYLRSLHRVPYE